MSQRRPVGWPLALVCVLVFTFLMAPSLVVVPMAFSSSAFLSFPPQGLSLQWFREYVTDAQWQAATWRSVRVALSVMGSATIVGTMLALAVSRRRGWTRTL